MIYTFIIIILFFEILYDLSNLFLFIQSYASRFLIFDQVLAYLFFLAAKCFNCLSLIASTCQIAIPCLLLKVLWLTYLHCPYKNTVKR